jgi:hypothetical protein
LSPPGVHHLVLCVGSADRSAPALRVALCIGFCRSLFRLAGSRLPGLPPVQISTDRIARPFCGGRLGDRWVSVALALMPVSCRSLPAPASLSIVPAHVQSSVFNRLRDWTGFLLAPLAPRARCCGSSIPPGRSRPFRPSPGALAPRAAVAAPSIPSGSLSAVQAVSWRPGAPSRCRGSLDPFRVALGRPGRLLARSRAPSRCCGSLDPFRVALGRSGRLLAPLAPRAAVAAPRSLRVALGRSGRLLAPWRPEPLSRLPRSLPGRSRPSRPSPGAFTRSEPLLRLLDPFRVALGRPGRLLARSRAPSRCRGSFDPVRVALGHPGRLLAPWRPEPLRGSSIPSGRSRPSRPSPGAPGALVRPALAGRFAPGQPGALGVGIVVYLVLNYPH